MRRFYPALLVVLGCVAYCNSLDAPFIFDDYATIVENPSIRTIFPVPLTPRGLYHISLRLNYAVNGLDVRGYHAVNLLFHILAGISLYFLVLRVLHCRRVCTTSMSGQLAFLAAATWLVHPVQTESVTYISQRTEVMAGFFMFLTVLLAARWFEGDSIWFGRLSVAACLVGMMSKQTMVMAPLLVFAYDWLLGPSSALGTLRKRPLYYTALGLSVIALGLLHLNDMAGNIALRQHTIGIVSPQEYLLAQPRSFVQYLKVAFVPYPLCFDYGWTPEYARVGFPFHAAVTGLVIGVCGMLMARRSPHAFPVFMFIAPLIPTTSILPLDDLVAEHRLYVSLAGITTLVAMVVGRMTLGRLQLDCAGRDGGGSRLGAVVWIAGVAIVCVCAMLTVVRNSDYGSEERLWEDVIRTRPENLRARLSLAVVRYRAGRFVDAEREVDTVISGISDKYRGYNATLYALAQDTKGNLLVGRSRFADAEKCFREAVTAAPSFQRAHANLGVALLRQGRTAEAVEVWTSALRHVGRRAEILSNLGSTMVTMGRHAEGARFLREALAEDPGVLPTRLALAWVLSVSGDDSVRNPGVALELLSHGSVDGKSQSALEIAAYAQAAMGQFDRAVSLIDLAIAQEQRVTGSSTLLRRKELLVDRKTYTVPAGVASDRVIPP